MSLPSALGPYFMAANYPQKIPIAAFRRLAAAFLDLDRDGRDPNVQLDQEGLVKYTDNERPGISVYNCFAWVIGHTDQGVEPAKDIPGFAAYFATLNLVTCDAEHATIDAWTRPENGRMIVTHASRKNPNFNPAVIHQWESKYNYANCRFTHNRNGLDQGNYGARNLHFREATAAERQQMAQTVTVGSADPGSQMQGSVEPQNLPGINNLTTSITTSFAPLAQKFGQNYAAWTNTWATKLGESSWSSVLAQGPEFDALVGMGTNILPFVIDKLGVKENVYAIHLYNKIQTDATKKVNPANLTKSYFLQYHAQELRTLYLAFLTSFNTAAEAWLAYLKTLPASSTNQCVGPTYTALVQLGKASAPLVMVRYAVDKNEWWGEVLSEIFTGKKAGVAGLKKEEVYATWEKWFVGGGSAVALGPSA